MAPGNAWHFPANIEAAPIVVMRCPLYPTNVNTSVRIYNGNQFDGGGNRGNQILERSRVFFKGLTDRDWQVVPMSFGNKIVNNKYFYTNIPLSSFAPKIQMQYYIVVGYSDHNDTFL
jgi:hypothetical protein